MRGRTHVGYHSRMAQVVFLLTRGPRTVQEILYLLGIPSHGNNGTSITKCLHALEEEGLVVKAGRRKTLPQGTGEGRSVLWRWVPFEELLGEAGSQPNPPERGTTK